MDTTATMPPPSSVDDPGDGLGPIDTVPAPGTEEPSSNGATAPPADTPPTPPADLGPDADPEPPAQSQLFLTGSRKLGVKVGGRKPDSTVLKVKGGKIEVEGQFDREDRFPVVFDLQVTGDGDDDAIDTASGHVKSTRKTQRATICGTSHLGTYLELKLGEDHPELLRAVTAALGLED